MAEVFALIFRYVYMYLWSTVVVAFITNVNDTCYSANVPVNSLYDISDEVCVLDNRTLTSTVYGSEQVWFVQFYSSWCGHCVHFAPTWKIFAEDIRGWQSIAKVAAVNCADQQNSKICSENIDVGFPTLRMFKALQKNGSGEINKGQRDVIHLRYALIDHVTKQNEEHRLPHWPMLSPVRVTWLLKALARFVKALQFIAVVFEDADSYAARELILDMINRKDVMVVRVLKQELINSLEATKWKVTRFPSLFIFKQSEEPTELLTSGKRESLYSSLQAYLNQSSSLKMENKGQSNQKILASIMAIHVDEKKTGHQRVTTMHHAGQTNLKENIQIAPKETLSRSVVHMQDLESTLIYSLNHEIGLQKSISGRSLSALKAYVAVLKKYFPGRTHVMNVLGKLHNLLQPQSGMSSEDWFNILKHVQRAVQDQQQSGVFLENDVTWVGCQGSTHKYRGYPCGLWILFHTLTVSQLDLEINYPDSDSKEVLHAMKGYMTYFFGCRVCSDNFNKESVNLESSVGTLDESVIWLWKIHNRVNKRLAGTLSEDPVHPKIQFPSKSDCQSCHDAKRHWRTSAVLQYMKTLYGVNNIDLSITGVGRKEDDMQTVVELKHEKANKITTYGYFNVGINTIDISMCLLLYTVCSVLLLVICIYVNHRRKRKYFRYII